jgi:hypothetical protein
LFSDWVKKESGEYVEVTPNEESSTKVTPSILTNTVQHTEWN